MTLEEALILIVSVGAFLFAFSESILAYFHRETSKSGSYDLGPFVPPETQLQRSERMKLEGRKHIVEKSKI